MSELWPNRLLASAERTQFWTGDARHAMTLDDDLFAQGVEQGRRTVEAEFAADREALLQLIGGLPALEAPTQGLLATMMLVAVERLVADIAGAAPIDADLLLERSQALADTIDRALTPILTMHPDDAALIDEDRIETPIATDVNLVRGTVRLRAGDICTEDGVAAALGRLRACIADMGIAL